MIDTGKWKYFSISEMTHSNIARARGWKNEPGYGDIERMDLLVRKLLDPLRELYGSAIYVSSGYRTPRLNMEVGGASGSQHMLGEAADISTGRRGENARLYDMLLNSKLLYDQVIIYNCYEWLHVSYTERRVNRMQVMIKYQK